MKLYGFFFVGYCQKFWLGFWKGSSSLKYK